MLYVNAVKIEIHTSSGLFGAYYSFSSGLNIIRGDNTTGKSSLYQAILYCLGLEELIGGRNEKTMQSVLKDSVEFPKGQTHKVLQSFTFLEIKNKNNEIITIRRSVKSETRSPKLVDVFDGAYLSNHQEGMKCRPMYVHDKGAASDIEFGFHAYIEEFLGWNLPKVYRNSGDLAKLYFQQVAPVFIIEQKRGWSGFLATSPSYGVTNKEGRVIEYILDLDVHENKKKKLKLLANKRILQNDWERVYKQLESLATRGNAVLTGVETKPFLISNIDDIALRVKTEDGDVLLMEHYESLISEMSEIEERSLSLTESRNDENEKLLEESNDRLTNFTDRLELMSRDVYTVRQKIKLYNEQKHSLENDLRKNKQVKKLKKLGGSIESKIASNICPTCDQEIQDSLLPEEVQQIPMRIDDNIDFIESQIKMVKAFVDGQEIQLTEKLKEVNYFKEQITGLRAIIRSAKRELVADSRLPSSFEIEEKLKLESKIQFYSNLLTEFDLTRDELLEISKAYFDILNEEKKYTKNFFSTQDTKKLEQLKQSFTSLLENFNYESKSTDLISISFENYLPVAQLSDGDEENKSYDLKFDSSATDFIRCIWAYTCSLYKASIASDGNHPRLLMFDEPKQHDISIDDFRDFLLELSTYKDGQALVFASFEESDIAFKKSTEGVEHFLIRIENKLIKPI